MNLEEMMPEEIELIKDMVDNPDRYPPVSLVSKLCDADILVVSGPMSHEVSREVVKTIRYSKEIRSKNMCLVLCTYGGQAEPAYIIARTIRRYYDNFILYVFGYCKSAGTIVALGADEIVFGDDGELGPLDVQVTKEDGLGQMQSGMEYTLAMKAVSSSAFDVFEEHFLKTMYSSRGTISLRTSIETAANIAIGLVAPIAAQLDPLRMGEIRRAMDIAFEYGVKLGADPFIVRYLIEHYPSHEFIIDHEEAKILVPQYQDARLGFIARGSFVRDA